MIHPNHLFPRTLSSSCHLPYVPGGFPVSAPRRDSLRLLVALPLFLRSNKYIITAMAPTILLAEIDMRTHPSYRLNAFMRRPDVLIVIFWWHALLRFLSNPPLLPPKRTSDQTRSLFLCRRAGVHARTRKNHCGSHIQLRCKAVPFAKLTSKAIGRGWN